MTYEGRIAASYALFFSDKASPLCFNYTYIRGKNAALQSKHKFISVQKYMFRLYLAIIRLNTEP